MKKFKKTLALFLVVLTLFTSISITMPVFATNDISLVTDGNVSEETENTGTAKNNSEPEILSEITEKREENIKHFIMSDGTFMVARYAEPVHYQDESGIWIDIDNTVTEAEATANQAELFGTDKIYTTSNLAKNIVFAEKSNSNALVSYEAKDYSISFNYQSAKNSKIKIVEDKTEFTGNDAYLTLPNVSEEVIYEDIFKNVDLQYIVSPTELKENIILRNSKAQNTFTVNYNIGELTAEVIDTKTVNLMAGNEVVYTITAPYMYDANGEKSENISFTVDKNKNGKLRIDITADSAWLQAEDRAYPVVIDPSIVEYDSTAITATYISNTAATTNYGDISSELYVSNGDSTYGTSYALLKLESLGSNIYADHVVSAKLNLPLNTSLSSGIKVYLHKITSDWDATTVTWDSVPSISTTVTDYCNLTASSTSMSFDVTKLYYQWNDLETVNGVALKINDTGVISFRSEDAESPVLLLNYISTVGIDEDYSYSEFDMGSAGYVYINNLSGNLVLTRDEFDSTGENYSYDFAKTYNSLGNISDSNPIWVESYDNTIYLGTAYYDSDGSAEVLKITKSETEESTYLLEENKYGWEKYYLIDHFTITFPTAAILGKDIVFKFPNTLDAWRNNGTERYRFNMNGLLEKGIETDDGEKLIFSREAVYNEDGTESEEKFCIVDGDGDKLLINNTDAYYSVTQIDYKSDGTSINGDVLVYTKDANGNTTQITLNGDVQATFTYDEENRMTSVTNDKGYKLTFGYEGESRKIASVAESKNGTAGQQVSFTRTYNSTIARTSGADGVFGNTDDLLTTYNFNGNAQLIGTQSETVAGEKLGTAAIEHDSDNNTMYGSVSKIAAAGKISDNLILNHNIESADNWTSFLLDDKSCSRTASYTTEESYVGEGSLKINVTDITTTGGGSYYQILRPSDGIVEIGKTYTLSAFVKTSGITRDSDAGTTRNHGAAVMVRIGKTDGTSTRSYSHSVQKTNADINNGWERVFVTFTVPEDTNKVTVHLVLRNGTGTAYFDGVQLEEGDTMSQYNMLENNGFTYAESTGYASTWKRWNLTSSDVVENGEMKIIGAAGTNKCVYQEVKVTEDDWDDKYVYGGWAHAAPVAKNGSRYYRIHILVFYKETNSSGSQISRVASSSDFNYYSDELQYTSGSFELPHPSHPEYTPDKIRVVCCYYQQLNTAYYDSVSLVKSGDVYEAETDTEDTSEETVTDPYTYDADGNILTYTDEDGIVYTYTYNSYGDIVSILNPDGTGDVFQYNEYDTDGDGTNDMTLIKKETYEDGTVCEYEYDADRNLTKETIVSDGVTTVYTYDAEGKLITESETPDTTYTYTYDTEGNMTSRLDSYGNGERYTYQYFDLNNNGEYDKYEISYENLENGEENWYTYNDKGNLTQMLHKENGKTLTYTYDGEGNVTSVEHNGFKYNYTYDAFSNTATVKVGSQALVTYGYQTDKSKLSTVTYGNGSGKETYTYNAYGEVVKKSISGIGNFTYKYDTLSRPVYEQDSANKQKTYYLYDDEGRLYGEMVNSTVNSNAYLNQLYSVRNTLNDDSKVTNEALTANGYTHNLPFTYDEEGRQATAALTSVRSLSYTYNADGQLSTRTLSTGTPIAETYTYTDDGLIATHRVDDATRDNIYSYTYDDNGNITEIKQDGNLIHSYVYDSDNQLVRENNSVSGKTTVFTYDGYGNISQKKEYAFTTGTLGTVTDTINYTYDTTWKDKLTSYDGQSITYDAIGNPLTYRGATMTWNGRQLMSYTKGDTSITYKYDVNGMRTQKVVNGEEYNYYYVDGKLMYEGNDTYDYYYRYDQEGRLGLILRRRLSDNFKWYYYPVSNSRGDIMEIHDGQGNISAKFNYDAWGKLISVTNASGTALADSSFAYLISARYRGYYYDSETGLYYLQSRYYDPEVGRFLNADSVDYIGYSGEDVSYNAFAYCENCPVNCIDVSGYITERLNERLNNNLANRALDAVVSYILPSKKITRYIDYARNNNYIYNVTIEYLENSGKYCGKYRTVELTFGHKKAWKKNSYWYRNFNDFTNNFTDYIGGVMQGVNATSDQGEVYVAAAQVVFWLGLLLGEYIKSSQSKKNYNLVWGPDGIDPEDNFGYYLFVAEWQGQSDNEYYVYSWIWEVVRKI